MALQVTVVKRTFKFGDKVLADPNTSMSPEEVISFYSNQFPQLTTSTIIGPVYSDDDSVEYEFKSAVGTKG